MKCIKTIATQLQSSATLSPTFPQGEGLKSAVREISIACRAFPTERRPREKSKLVAVVVIDHHEGSVFVGSSRSLQTGYTYTSSQWLHLVESLLAEA